MESNLKIHVDSDGFLWLQCCDKMGVQKSVVVDDNMLFGDQHTVRLDFCCPDSKFGKQREAHYPDKAVAGN